MNWSKVHMSARFFAVVLVALAALAMTVGVANAFSLTFCKAQCRYDRQCSKKGVAESQVCDMKCTTDCEKKAADQQ